MYYEIICGPLKYACICVFSLIVFVGMIYVDVPLSGGRESTT